MKDAPPLPLTHSEVAGKKPVYLVRAAVRIAVITGNTNARQCLFIRHPVKGLELPGGAIEPGEIPLQAAFRELHEEAGIQLSPAQPTNLLAFIPLVDSRGGHWLDALYVILTTSDQLTIQKESEFPVFWLTAEEIQIQVHQGLSSYQASLMALDAVS